MHVMNFNCVLEWEWHGMAWNKQNHLHRTRYDFIFNQIFVRDLCTGFGLDLHVIVSPHTIYKHIYIT